MADGQTDGRMELLYLVQRYSMRALRRAVTKLRSTRHNAVKPYGLLVTRFLGMTSSPCDELTGSQDLDPFNPSESVDRENGASKITYVVTCYWSAYGVRKQLSWTNGETPKTKKVSKFFFRNRGPRGKDGGHILEQAYQFQLHETEAGTGRPTLPYIKWFLSSHVTMCNSWRRFQTTDQWRRFGRSVQRCPGQFRQVRDTVIVKISTMKVR